MNEHAEAAEDLKNRIHESIRIFQQVEKPLWERTKDGQLTLKKLNISDLPETLFSEIEKGLVRINGILKGYDIETWDDYRKISDHDLMRIQGIFIGFLDLF